MSYDIYLLDPKTRETIYFDKPHDLKGGTYAIGGTCEAWLNVTYNYVKLFKSVFGEKGIRRIYGMTGAASIPLLEAAIAQFDGDRDPDYWRATEGNVKAALNSLLQLAKMRPDGIWDGD